MQPTPSRLDLDEIFVVSATTDELFHDDGSMVRSYLRHGETAAFGLIASSSSVSVFDGALAFVPALEDVLVWDVKKGEQVRLYSVSICFSYEDVVQAAMWHETGHRALVTCMARHTDGERFAVGYADGSIRLWSAYTKSVLITFDGHRKAITSLAFDASGTRLASGSQDTDVIVWDVLAEAGMFRCVGSSSLCHQTSSHATHRLRGHRDQITSLHLLSPSADSNEATHLISTSKEGLLKLWHLPTQHCLDTAVAHRTECWTSAIIPQAADSEEVILLTGGSEGELRLFSLTLSSPSLATEQPDASTSTAPATGKRSIVPLGPVTLSSTTHNQRISLISVHPSLPLLAIQTSERHVEVCRIRSEEDVRRKAKRRERREREKASTKGLTIATTTNPTDEDDGRISWTDRIGSWQLLNAGAKIRSFAFATGLAPVNRKARRKGKSTETSGELSILLALSNNSVETWSLPSPEASKEIVAATPPARLHAIRMQGHRTDVRALAVSSDDQLVVSASNGEVKIWNRRTGRCLRTMETGYALCCQWLPGDKHVRSPYPNLPW